MQPALAADFMCADYASVIFALSSMRLLHLAVLCHVKVAAGCETTVLQSMGAFGSFNEPYYRSFITTYLGACIIVTIMPQQPSSARHTMCLP